MKLYLLPLSSTLASFISNDYYQTLQRFQKKLQNTCTTLLPDLNCEVELPQLRSANTLWVQIKYAGRLISATLNDGLDEINPEIAKVMRDKQQVLEKVAWYEGYGVGFELKLDSKPLEEELIKVGYPETVHVWSKVYYNAWSANPSWTFEMSLSRLSRYFSDVTITMNFGKEWDETTFPIGLFEEFAGRFNQGNLEELVCLNLPGGKFTTLQDAKCGPPVKHW